MNAVSKEGALMSVKKHRLDRGWSQEQLAQISGLSVRTVQRIEQGQKAGLESLKCLAAAFDTNISELIKEDEMSEAILPKQRNSSRDEEEALEYVKNLKGFHMNWMAYAVVIPCLYILNITVSPAYLWVVWPAMGWGIGITLHAVNMFGLFGVFGADWERRQFEKRMNNRRH